MKYINLQFSLEIDLAFRIVKSWWLQSTTNELVNQQSPHTLAKYTKEPWLYPPLLLTKERSSVGRA